ncbi:hypothetical protein IQ06DRAFT_301416 [Phaeosphaeriaceae sp. SRC1lsM3a]|nr:hypothetical protein IQ06DRAFT_301416 [Stagonospora sp. SRC1lsM3a]
MVMCTSFFEIPAEVNRSERRMDKSGSSYALHWHGWAQPVAIKDAYAFYLSSKFQIKVNWRLCSTELQIVTVVDATTTTATTFSITHTQGTIGHENRGYSSKYVLATPQAQSKAEYSLEVSAGSSGIGPLFNGTRSRATPFYTVENQFESIDPTRKLASSNQKRLNSRVSGHDMEAAYHCSFIHSRRTEIIAMGYQSTDLDVAQ